MKRLIRKELIAKRDALAYREQMSESIWERLRLLGVYKNAQNIMCYASFGSEVDTNLMQRGILKDGKKLYLPRCEVQDRTMSAVRVTDLATLIKGAYGILEPVGEGISPTELDLCIIPLVAFDKSLSRLGYGGGYYDRFLIKTNAKRCAVAFSAQQTDKIPTEDTDIPMDMIVTERAVIV